MRTIEQLGAWEVVTQFPLMIPDFWWGRIVLAVMLFLLLCTGWRLYRKKEV